jgi:hypothetical protein
MACYLPQKPEAIPFQMSARKGQGDVGEGGTNYVSRSLFLLLLVSAMLSKFIK